MLKMAWAYTKYLTDQAVFDAELAARRERVRLWRDAEPMEPWVFRSNLHESHLNRAKR